ncbi:hypothetical protein Tco_1204840 [Tanacetum coccineum]
MASIAMASSLCITKQELPSLRLDIVVSGTMRVQSGLKLNETLLLLAHESLAPFGFCKQNCGVSSIYAFGKMQVVLVTSR